MAGMKKLFDTPKKAVITIGCMIVVFAAALIGIVYARNAIEEKSSIGAENAKNFAFVDAGVDPVDARNVHVEFEHEQGQFVYEVEFEIEHKGSDFDTAYGYPVSVAEYTYWINASNGAVVKKEVSFEADTGTVAGNNSTVGGNDTATENNNDTVGGNDTAIENNNDTVGGNDTATETGSSGTSGGAGAVAESNDTYIGIDQAKAVAVGHAGLSVSDVVFSKAKLDHDDGLVVYEIEFYKGGMEYEYEINAVTGDILEYDWD